jgi:hypothetical protein
VLSLKFFRHLLRRPVFLCLARRALCGLCGENPFFFPGTMPILLLRRPFRVHPTNRSTTCRSTPTAHAFERNKLDSNLNKLDFLTWQSSKRVVPRGLTSSVILISPNSRWTQLLAAKAVKHKLDFRGFFPLAFSYAGVTTKISFARPELFTTSSSFLKKARILRSCLFPIPSFD